MANGRPVVGLAPAGANSHGSRAVVGLPPSGPTGRAGRPVVGLPPAAHQGGNTTAGRGPTRSRSGTGGALHWLASKVGLAAHDIKSIPGGAVQFAKANVNDTLHGHSFLQDPADIISGKSQTGKIVHASVKQTVETVKHPLRDPFQTALLVSPIGHGLGSVIERGAAAGDALDAGAGAKAVAKAIVKNPEVKPRGLVSGGKETPLIPSKNAGARLVQRGYDKVLQKGLDEKPQGRVAAHAQKRIGGALDEEARIQQKMRAVPAAMLDKAAGKLSKLPAARREEQAALELTSANTAPEDAARYHQEQAAKGVNAARNTVVAKLYQRVADRGLLTRDEHGDVVVDAGKHPKLAKTDAALARVQERGDKILVEKGVREPAALKARVDAPGRIRAGGTYEKTVAAKGRVEQTREYPARSKTVSRELSPEEAHARLASLDKIHADLVKKVIPEVSPYGPQLKGTLAKNEQMARNYSTGKSGLRRMSVKQEEAQIADEKLREIVARNPDHPAAKRMADVLAERDELRARLTQHGEASLEGAAPPPLPSVTETIPGKPRRVHLREIQAQKAGGKIVGGETARPGRGFVSARISEKKLSKAEASASRGPVVGAAKSPLDSKTFTGRSIEQGLVPKHVTAAASRHFRSIVKFVNTDARRRAALETGSDIRRSDREVLVREPDEKAEPITSTIRQALGQEKSTVDTAEELGTEQGLQAAHQMFVNRIFDRADASKTDAIGVKAPDGYKWVDKGALGDLTKAAPGPRGNIAKSFDAVNTGITAATVYFKLGHIPTRFFTNASTNIIQGSAAPHQIGKSYQLWDKLSDEDRARALAASGQHGYAALPHEGTNPVARFAGFGAQWYAKHWDAPFRFNSLAFELRKIGVDTPEKFTKALDGLESAGQGLPAHEWSKLSAAARRADREAISYDRLNDFERRYIARAVWFFPWIKGSTLFTVRTLVEHPFKAAALGAAGVQGREAQQRDLGPVPSYEEGLVKLAGGGSNPTVTDLSTFSPFATAADVLGAPIHPGAIAGFLNPVAGSAGQLAYGLNQYGSPSKTPINDALLALGSATPEQQLAEAYATQGQDQSNRLFRKTVGNTFERYLFGPAVPRKVNLAALAKAAAREKSGQR